MKRLLPLILIATAISCGQKTTEPIAQIEYSQFFTDSTLRLDYVFCGDASHQAIYLQSAYKAGQWAGRRRNLGEPLVEGNGQIRVLDGAGGTLIYCNSFSTLFQEWQSYPEAKRVQRAWENSFLVPFPKDSVEIEIVLFDIHHKESARMRHPLNPSDILIRQLSGSGASYRALGEEKALDKAVDVVILSEGYTAAEEDKFWADATRASEAILSHEPFTSRSDDFCFRAVFSPSRDSGPSVPHDGLWNRTTASSHFDTFYSQRYLTTSSVQDVYNAIGNVPFEQIIVLANTPVYGGGGIFNSLTIMGSDHSTFNQVLVHEFGHAFGGLGDEYAYADEQDNMYPADTEPWEPNITTLKDFGSKWQDLVDSGEAGLFEGAGYQLHGVYRPAEDCRMKTNQCKSFCPVCTRAINKAIDFYTKTLTE